MRHRVKLTREEKAKIWLELCDFSFRLMQSALRSGQLAARLKRMRELHLEKDKRMLLALARTGK
jgi:hypothetical protein